MSTSSHSAADPEEQGRAPGVWAFAGPGIIWSMSAIGQTHVVLSTYAGARFGFDLLWMVVLAHLLSYPLYEYGARYSLATGHTLSNAYLEMRGVRWLVVPFFGLMFSIMPFLMIASLGSVVASITMAAFPQLGFEAWVIIIAIGTLALVYAGQYALLERLNIVMAFLLLIGVTVAFGLRPPGPGELAMGMVPAVPELALVTLVAMMRLPNDPGSSLMLSGWAIERRLALSEVSTGEALRGTLLGLRAGYLLSLFVAIVFLALGATVLKPRGVDLEGIDLALQLSHVFTDTVGAWTFPMFIVIAFVALFSGYYAAVDGVPRVFEDMLLRVRGKTPGADTRWIQGVHRIVIVVGGTAVAVGVGKPAFLVLLAVSLGLIGYPLIYALNLYAAVRLTPAEYGPHPVNLVIAAVGFVFACCGGVLLVVTRL